jgi:hypothetical protein
MIHRWLLIGLACAGTCLSPCVGDQPVKEGEAQPAPERFTVFPKFRQGEKVEYDLTVPPAKGPGAALGPMTMLVTITVLETTEQATLIEWRHGRPKWANAPAAQAEALADAASAAFDFVPRLRLDHETKGFSLDNIEAAQAWTKRTTDAELENLAKRGAKPEDVERMRRAYATIINDPQLLQASVLKQPGLWLSTLWQEGLIGKTEELDVDQPNPFGQGTLKLTRSVRVTRDDAASLMRISISSEPKPGEMARIMRAMVDRAKGEPLEADMEKDMLEKHARFIIENDSTIDQETGWPETIHHKSEFTYDGGAQKEERKMVRRRPEPPPKP